MKNSDVMGNDTDSVVGWEVWRMGRCCGWEGRRRLETKSSMTYWRMVVDWAQQF